MNIRENMEQLELSALNPFAAFSAYSKGREVKETECDIRTIYQRDRDRILHSKAFRRLKDKTQVFLTPQGDHYRTRLTHTLEVSQTGRTVAKALRLNEDLVEAIALGHDLGHTPFGHAGERALNSISPLGFAHYQQSVRVVELLEKKGQGLNLTYEVRDGILNHRTSGDPHTLEGQIVRLCDKISYIHHDLDDAVRAEILTEEQLPEKIKKVLGDSTRKIMNTLIHNIVQNSQNVERIQMSEDISEAMKELRSYMFEHVYKNPMAKKEEDKAIKMICQLYEYYIKNPDKMAPEYVYLIEHQNEPCQRVVCDYISGMTDQYAISKFTEVYIPKSWEKY